jgi:hypothetical protein
MIVSLSMTVRAKQITLIKLRLESIKRLVGTTPNAEVLLARISMMEIVDHRIIDYPTSHTSSSEVLYGLALKFTTTFEGSFSSAALAKRVSVFPDLAVNFTPLPLSVEVFDWKTLLAGLAYFLIHHPSKAILS